VDNPFIGPSFYDDFLLTPTGTSPYNFALDVTSAISALGVSDEFLGLTFEGVTSSGAFSFASRENTTWPGPELLIDIGPPDPTAMLQQLLADVTGVGPGTSLADKVSLAQTYYTVPDIQAACLILGDFKSQVAAQAGKKLTHVFAARLSTDATEIMTAIGCT
jgi:hypothetical protein